MVTVQSQQPIDELSTNWYAAAEQNRQKANKNDADLADAVNEVAGAAVREINGVKPNSAGSITLALGAKADPLTQVQIDGLPSSGLVPGRIVLNTDTQQDEIIGSDGVARSLTLGLFGDGSDGDVTISGTVTLTRTMYYRRLTVPAGTVLIPNGFRIFVSELATINGAIRAAGVVGVSPMQVPGLASATLCGAAGGKGGIGGTAGQYPGYSSSATMIAGGTGGLGNGATLRAIASAILGGAGSGGDGGWGGRAGGYNPNDGGGTFHNVSPGGSTQPNSVGGWGGGGIVVAARRLEGSGVIESTGTPGIAGADGYTQNGTQVGGNGGGGGGGAGGIVVVTHRGRVGSIVVRSVGGAGGNGGSGSSSATPGQAGGTGGSGAIVELVLAT